MMNINVFHCNKSFSLLLYWKWAESIIMSALADLYSSFLVVVIKNYYINFSQDSSKMKLY